MKWLIREATYSDVNDIARLVKDLTDEIIERTTAKHFNVNIEQITKLLKDFLESGKYSVLVALQDNKIVGFANLCPSYALYAEGNFGIVQEFYVVPEHRSSGLGAALIKECAILAKNKGWKRLELCTPPIPEFDPTIKFYQTNGFEITGGRKMKKTI